MTKKGVKPYFNYGGIEVYRRHSTYYVRVNGKLIGRRALRLIHAIDSALNQKIDAAVSMRLQALKARYYERWKKGKRS